jgi:spermidine synthase
VSLTLPMQLALEPYAQGVGRLYGINTLGCVAGAAAAAWVFLPTIGAYGCAVACGAALALFGSTYFPGRACWTAAALTALATAGSLLLGSGVGRSRVQAAGMAFELQPLFSVEGADATVSVASDAASHRQLIIDGFQTSGEAPEGHYMAWMGHLPMALHPHPRRALVICFGTGQTANAVRNEGPETLDIVELSSSVIAAARYFSSNQRVLEDGRVHVRRTDGRAWLRRSVARYDVITLEPMDPHFAGTNDLYSLEFYRDAERHLDDDGVIAQWLPLHLLLPSEAVAVVRTFAEVFPNSALWIDPNDRTGILVGRKGSRLPVDTLRREDSRDRLRDLDRASVRAAFVLSPTLVQRYASLGDLITDDNQRLAFSLTRAQLWRIGGHAGAHALNLEIIQRISRSAE